MHVGLVHVSYFLDQSTHQEKILQIGHKRIGKLMYKYNDANGAVGTPAEKYTSLNM